LENKQNPISLLEADKQLQKGKIIMLYTIISLIFLTLFITVLLIGGPIKPISDLCANSLLCEQVKLSSNLFLSIDM